MNYFWLNLDELEVKLELWRCLNGRKMHYASCPGVTIVTYVTGSPSAYLGRLTFVSWETGRPSGSLEGWQMRLNGDRRCKEMTIRSSSSWWSSRPGNRPSWLGGQFWHADSYFNVVFWTRYLFDVVLWCWYVRAWINML